MATFMNRPISNQTKPQENQAKKNIEKDPNKTLSYCIS